MTTWMIEFPASTIGEANDLLRQAAGLGHIPLTATPAGRLGFEAVGPKSWIDEAAKFLRGGDREVYVTRSSPNG